jgi:hypothetical protein
MRTESEPICKPLDLAGGATCICIRNRHVSRIRMCFLPYPAHFDHAHISRGARVLVQVFAIDCIIIVCSFAMQSGSIAEATSIIRRFVIV